MENLDLTQILEGCPEGTKLYSPLFGDVTLFEISDTPPRIVKVRDNRKVCWQFKHDGRYYNIEDAECMLFPSKDNRDWSTFKPEQPKPEHKFKPFDRVLVRDRIDNVWVAQLYSHCREDEGYLHFCVGGQFWLQCIPYKGNEHLLGTTDKPKEE